MCNLHDKDCLLNSVWVYPRVLRSLICDAEFSAEVNFVDILAEKVNVRLATAQAIGPSASGKQQVHLKLKLSLGSPKSN